MSTSKDTGSGPTTSTETTTIALAPLNSSYARHTEFYTTIKDLMDESTEYWKNLISEFKESVKNIIADQDAKVDKIIEKQIQPLSLWVKDISSKQSEIEKLFNKRLENMSNKNRISTKYEITRAAIEYNLNMKLNEYKSKTSSSISMKLLTINPNKMFSSYDQHSADLIKCKLFKSPEKYFHASKLTKHLLFMTLEGNTLIQIEIWWDAIISDFCQYLPPNKI